MAELQTIARPYADAAFEVAREQNALPQWSEALGRLAQIIGSEPAHALISNPRLDAAQITSLLAETAGSLTGEQNNFVRVLAENERLAALPEIADQFQHLRNATDGTLEVTVQSAYEVTAAQADAIRISLEEKYGRKVRLATEVDDSLIGGICIRLGDEVIDASVRGKLARLAASLKN